MVPFKQFIISGILMLLLAACSNNTTDKKQETNKHDSVALDSSKIIVTHKVPEINKGLNDIGKYVAGLSSPTTTIDSALLKNTAWLNFANTLNKNWSHLDSTRFEKMRSWQKSELAPQVKASTIFYPFAGADALNVLTLFPHAKNYIMVGLEPVGSLPNFSQKTTQDSLTRYFNSINQSLYSILNFSFFRTIAMASDFHKTELNGTLHINILFLERLGNSLIDIKYVNIKSDGTLQNYTSFEEARKDSLQNKGVEITFIDKDSTEHTLYYFSSNLANDGIAKHPGLVKFADKHDSISTYLKSASYLMHKDYFSDIRTFILTRSKLVLQDDSGIPYNFFTTPENTWTIFHYGTYNGPIGLFSGFNQLDLKQAYGFTEKVKPLPFGIGYKYKLGESNLMLGIKSKK